MAEKIYERVSEKVMERIVKDTKETFKPVIEKVFQDLDSKGFRRQDVGRHIQDGFDNALDEVRDKR